MVLHGTYFLMPARSARTYFRMRALRAGAVMQVGRFADVVAAPGWNVKIYFLDTGLGGP